MNSTGRVRDVEYQFDFAGGSDIGRVRSQNQDRWAADAEQGLYIVADGMGGHAAGEVAAQIVVEVLPTLLSQPLRTLDLEGKEVNGNESEPPAADDEPPPEDEDEDEDEDDVAAEDLRLAVCELSEGVHELSRGQPELHGMGATVVLGWIRGSIAHIAQMGDSRAYLLREGSLRQITKDQTVIQLLIDNGELTPEQAKSHPARAQVTRFIGMPGDPLPELYRLELQPGDRLLLCSDGLTGMIDDAQLRDIIATADDPSVASTQLIDAANEAGGRDNITVLLIDCRAPSR